MTQFAAVDDQSRLWQVTDLLTAEQVQHIQAIDWSSVATTRVPQQHFWLREQVCWDEPAVQEAAQWISACLPVINLALGTSFTECGGHFWIDLPGFDCAMHTDGHLSTAMQIYWLAPDHTYGTGFYRHKQADTLVHQFESRPNTGYIMLNHPLESGAQPLQWHGMFHTVPEGSVRVSSYWQFR